MPGPQGTLLNGGLKTLSEAPPPEVWSVVQAWSRAARAPVFTAPPARLDGAGRFGGSRSTVTLRTDSDGSWPGLPTPGTMLHALTFNPFWAQSPDHEAWDRALDLLVHSPAVLAARNLEGFPLLFSVLMRDVPAYRDRLLDRGILATVRERLRDGRSVAHLLSRGGPEGLLQRCLDAGAPVNAQDDNGDTALILTTANSTAELTQVLLDAGADPLLANRPERGGHTALHAAAEGCHPAVLRCLLATGMDLNVRNAHGDTALDLVQRRLPKAGDLPDPAWEDPAGCRDLLVSARVERERVELMKALPIGASPSPDDRAARPGRTRL